VGVGFAFFSAIAGHFFGGGHDHDLGTGGHAEAGFDHSGLPGISPFSPTFIACFSTAFGALGFLPELAGKVSEPLSKTEKMVIVNTGNGAGGGASKLTGEVSQILSQLPPVIEGLTGLKLEELLRRVPSLKSSRSLEKPEKE
jgi:hypothetical protein